jgi:NADH/NAD ratio-sensing transcriptional regulator Rex
MSATVWNHSESSEHLLTISKTCITLIDRIWKLSSAILSSQGSTAADNEIARIYDMLEDTIEEGQQDTVHIDLLSNCWRAIKESR